MSNVNLPISELRNKVSGRVITSEDAGYDEIRRVFPGGFDDLRPAIIVRAADAADVSSVLEFARETGLELAVRSGGHSGAGHATVDGGIVLDLGEMRALEIDPESRTAWAEVGATAAEYTTAAQKHGLATGFGDTGSVGLGGITLSGGIGFLVRKHGMTIDSLLAAELVMADGTLLQVDADTHPDLFWAIRGGGGNFGVLTRVKLRLHDVGTIVGGMLVLPATPEVLAGFMAASDAAPEELTTIANVMPAPPMPFLPEEQHGKLIVLAVVAYAGDPADGERALAPLRALATPLADMVQPMPYAQLFEGEEDDYHPTAVGHTMFLDYFDETVAKHLIDRLEASEAAFRVAQLRALGGAMVRVSDDATAFAHRQSKFMASLAAFYSTEEERKALQAWVTELAAEVQQKDTGTYVGFLNDEGPERVRAAYPGGTWDRLVSLKKRYDPENLFRRNQNIPPA